MRLEVKEFLATYSPPTADLAENLPYPSPVMPDIGLLVHQGDESKLAIQLFGGIPVLDEEAARLVARVDDVADGARKHGRRHSIAPRFGHGIDAEERRNVLEKAHVAAAGEASVELGHIVPRPT